MPLRIGFDMDGVLADFSLAFREVETRLFGAGPGATAGEPAREEENQEQMARRSEDARLQTKEVALNPDSSGKLRDDREKSPARNEDARTGSAPSRDLRRRRDLVWQAIQSTPNFWSTLKPIDDDAVRRIHGLMLRHKWEVFFITQRPQTEGDTVQRQTQLWLVQQGFDLPSVLALGGSRGAAAGALRLDYHVDDSAQNCLDVISDSKAKPILIVADSDETTLNSARQMGVGTAQSIGECLDILENATMERTQPGLLQRLASFVGWKD